MTTHNPENVPMAAVPSGWRFMYKGEKLAKGTPNRLWHGDEQWGRVFKYEGDPNEHDEAWTYIVPGEPDAPADEPATLRDAVKAAYEALELIAGAHPTARRLDYQECMDTATKALKLLQPHTK